MNKLVTGLAAVIIILACKNTASNEKGNTIEPKDLIGEWNNLSIRINIQSKNNSDSSEIFEVNGPEWEERLRIKPIRTYFRTDSTWNSAHYNLEDSLVYNPSGKWWVEKNNIVMLQSFPSPDTTIYSLSLQKDTASFEAMLDWDMDGKKDDQYFGRQVKVYRQ